MTCSFLYRCGKHILNIKAKSGLIAIFLHESWQKVCISLGYIFLSKLIAQLAYFHVRSYQLSNAFSFTTYTRTTRFWCLIKTNSLIKAKKKDLVFNWCTFLQQYGLICKVNIYDMYFIGPEIFLCSKSADTSEDTMVFVQIK